MPKMTDEQSHEQFTSELNRMGFHWRSGYGWFHSSGRQLFRPEEESPTALCQRLGISYTEACRRLLLKSARKMVRSLYA